MAATHLLDSSVYCQPLKPLPLKSVVARWKALGDQALATSVICEAEVLFGLELRRSEKLNRLYAEVLRDRLPLYPVDREVSLAFARAKASARKRGKVCSDFDFLIAATAQVHGLAVATLNAQHFRFIEDLEVEDWSTPLER